MKLLYTILGTYNSGGMERVLANKANYLARHGYEITIVTTDQKNRKPYFKLDPSIRLIDLGINYTDDLGKGFISRGISFLKKNIEHKRKLKKLLFQIKPDITVSMFDNDASFIPDINDGSKKVLEIHFSRFKRIQYGRKGIWKLIDNYRSKADLKTVKRFDRFVVLTEEDKGYWGELPNIQVIQNANSFESDLKAKLENKQVLAIGRFDYQKGFDDLIEIWSKVYEKYPNWRLNIFGHGPLKEKYEYLIRSLKLQDVVSLHPPTSDIKSVYLEHSILAMTSRYEGLPMVLLEAQVCGLPMVSYTCKCGPKDIITSGENGYLIREGNNDEFAERLIQLMEDAYFRKELGKAAALNSVNYQEQHIMAQWMTLFTDLIQK